MAGEMTHGDPPAPAPGETAAAWPLRGTDMRVALATSMVAAPGVYAFLVGSGLSLAAGVPTGWDVVKDLVGRIADAEDADLEAQGGDAMRWWEAAGRGEPRYDQLLEVLGLTSAARQALLRRYFEATSTAPAPVPSAAHRGIANLVARGYSRVIVTTNFDRLLERALDEAGVAPQVIATPADIRGMTPLAHASATVIKVHGDYLSSEIRNTAGELEVYPAPWRKLLRQVFDEYGLVVAGWSADWDRALVQQMTSSPSRRYPVFWATFRDDVRTAAAQVINIKQAATIRTEGADEFLADLTERVQRLEARRNKPRGPRVSSKTSPFAHTATPPGWAVAPLLRVTSEALIPVQAFDDPPILRSKQRRDMVAAIRGSKFDEQLRQLAAKLTPLTANINDTQPFPEALQGWEAIPQQSQSTAFASYRLGGDASSGVAARLGVDMPGLQHGNHVLVRLDVAISAEESLLMPMTAVLSGLALHAAGYVVPEALGEISSTHTDELQLFLTFAAPSNNGQGLRRKSPSLGYRMGWSSFEPDLMRAKEITGASLRLDSSATEADVLQAAVLVLEHMALDAGALDTERYTSSLRQGVKVFSESAQGLRQLRG